MKVLHINTRQTAGAALCAMRISKALEAQGIDSRMLFAEGETIPDGINGAIAEQDNSFWYYNSWLLRFKYLLVRTPFWQTMDKERLEIILKNKNKRLEKKLYLHGPFSSYKNIAHHPWVEWADIIHLHWVTHFVDYPTFFAEVKKPIVWTLHDKFPITGIQHYISDFYPIPVSLRDIDAFCRKIKREGVLKARNLNIVAISELMENECKKSDVLKGFPVTLIHNGVNTDVFQPYNRQEARKELNLDKDATIFFFTANSIDDENKGFDRAVEALSLVNAPNKMLLCIGKKGSIKKLPQSTFPILFMEYISAPNILAKYYAASNYFLQCSYEETFAQAPLEAMACGIPVISTPCSGASDLIRAFNGVICKGFDAEALAVGIREALATEYDTTTIRQYILGNYQYEKIAQQYVRLYEQVAQTQYEER